MFLLQTDLASPIGDAIALVPRLARRGRPTGRRLSLCSQPSTEPHVSNSITLSLNAMFPRRSDEPNSDTTSYGHRHDLRSSRPRFMCPRRNRLLALPNAPSIARATSIRSRRRGRPRDRLIFVLSYNISYCVRTRTYLLVFQ